METKLQGALRLLNQALQCFENGGYTEEAYEQAKEDLGEAEVGEPFVTVQAIREWLRENK